MTRTRWWIAISLSLTIQSYVLYYAFHYGTLSGLIQYDECGIILRGLQNLDWLAQGKSLFGMLRVAHHLAIHAPLSDVQTMLGLLLSGGQTWGPYLLNATWLTLVLEALLRTFDRKSWPIAATIVLFVVVQALTINALADVKSDWAGGLLLAGALFLLTQGALRARPEWKTWGAVLLAVSTLSKLTAFYLPFVAVAVLLLFEWYSVVLEMWRQPDATALGRRRIPDLHLVLRSVDRRALLQRLLIGAGPFVLFFLFHLRSTVSYVRSATGPVWDDGLTIFDRLKFYGPFSPDSQTQWGNLHIFFAIFVPAALLLAWRRKQREYPIVLLLHVVVGAMLFLPLILANSEPSFESTLLGVIMSATMVSMDYLARSLPGRGALVVGVGTLLVALPAALPFRNTHTLSVSNTELRQLASTYDKIVDLMVMQSQRDAPHVAVFYDHLFAPPPNLAIEYFQKAGSLPTVDRVDDLANIGYIGPLSRVDFLLTIVPTSDPSQPIPGLYPAWPLTHDPVRADTLARASGQFELIGKFGVRGGEIHLFSNRRPPL